MKKVAIVYDRVNKWGGAERVLISLHGLFPDAPLFTSLYDPKKAEWANIFPKVYTSILNKIPYLRDKHELLGTIMPFAFESFNFRGYDLVISVTSEAAKGVVTSSSTKHICYCLTPTRYLWSHYEDYFKKKIFRFISKPAVDYLRRWDRVAGQRPDIMVAISDEVKKRINKYYGRDSIIIHPPVDVAKFRKKEKNLQTEKSKKIKPGYFLIVSRLVPYKKVDLAICAFNKLKKPLVIVGRGRQEKKLKRMAKANVKFVGEVKEEDLVLYYQNAKALIMPQEEDFGIVAVEAMASGCPVIAYKKGGALDIVSDGVSGLFFENATVEALVDAVKKFARMEFKTENLVSNAEKFSEEIFKKNLLNLINKL